MKRWRILLVASALASSLGLAGCANALRASKPQLPPFRDASMSLQAANDIILLGKTTKTEALASLGPGLFVKFDSGFEVWIYRAKSTVAQSEPAEFVILFTPEGVASKTRIRPSYGKSG